MSTPQLRLALISDIQYANINDAHDYGGFELRTYAASLAHTRAAVEAWRALDPPPACTLQLGDLIDGQNGGKFGQGLSFDAPRSRQALREALDALRGAPGVVYHAVGNHELYNFTWDELHELLNVGSHVASREGRFYHSFSPAPGWRVAVLNAYEVSEMQPAHLPGHAEAVALLRAHNQNYQTPGRDFFDDLPLERQRFVPFNGGFGRRQLEWLGDTLSDAARLGERVCVASHLPLLPEAASHRNVAFDAEEARALLAARPGLVPLYLAGHKHKGGYARCDGGVHHVTLQAPLTHGLCYAHLDLFEDHALLVGGGAHRSHHLAFSRALSSCLVLALCLMALSGVACTPVASPGAALDEGVAPAYFPPALDADLAGPVPDLGPAIDPCDPNPCPAGVRCLLDPSGAALCPALTCDDLRCAPTELCVEDPGAGEGARCVEAGCDGDEQCPLESFCDLSDPLPSALRAGRCAADRCAASELRCADGGVVETCDPSGAGFEPLYACDPARSACAEEPAGGASCLCEDAWDCPDYMRCELGRCRGRAAPPACLLPPARFEDSLPTPELTWGAPPNTPPAEARAVDSPFPESVQVVMTPLVVNLNDDNGDGLVNELDTPDIVFMSFCDSAFTTNGALRAIHGGGARRGRDLWATLGGALWREGDPLPDPASYRCADGDLDPTSSLAAADLDDPATSDGRVEILAVHEDDGLVIYGADGARLAEAFVGAMPNEGSNPSVAVANLDGQGMAEAVVGNAVITFARDPSGALLAVDLFTGSLGKGTNGQGALSCVADLDGDGRAEVIGGGTAYALPAPPAGAARRADCAGQGGGVAPQTPSEEAYCRGELVPLWDAVQVNQGVTLNGLSPSREGFCAVADVWGADPQTPPGPANPPDGAPEVLLITNGALHVLDGRTGALIYAQRHGANNDRGGAPNVDDFDGDGLPEVGSAFASGYVMMDLQPPSPRCPEWPSTLSDDDAEGRAALPPRDPGPQTCTSDDECAPGEAVCRGGACRCLHNGWRSATEDDSSRVTGSTLFDFNGDGAAEVIYNDECFFRVYDGRDGRALFKAPSESRTRVENPIVADVDNDGNAELIFSTSTESGFCSVRAQLDAQGVPYRDQYNPGVEVWGDPQDRWVPARRVWSQHAYHVTHITEAGRVPAHPVANWAPNSPYNSYRSQPRAYGVAPDLQVSALRASVSAGCGGVEGLILSAEVTNDGEVRVGEGIRLLFEGERGGARAPLLTPAGEPLSARTQQGLNPGARLTLSATYDPASDPANPAGALPERVWATIDAEEGSDFGRERECREDNNDLSAPVLTPEGLAELRVELTSLTLDYCPAATLTLRAANRGALDAPILTLALYAGDPATGGERLDSYTHPTPLAAGEELDITWETRAVPYARTVRLFVVVDQLNLVEECDETDNTSAPSEPVRCVERDGGG